ncbi:Flp family type IVb pilin [Roseomonas xinghualingensis]|uniref:Flp family type IVb pilin n=1 Tax=Roseomonas xinghualingensis TaxID=2986475 RepID=UPI0021F1EC38|nr:Flp family type IVb pilin [Roseomonas sp. SXEYE001]MCV4208704.1 Flp family type IVb pilin [Roseomonas sp. SXEYE001]
MMGQAFALLANLKADRKGVTALEYGVIAAVMVVAVAGVVGGLGDQISAKFTEITTTVTRAGAAD